VSPSTTPSDDRGPKVSRPAPDADNSPAGKAKGTASAVVQGGAKKGLAAAVSKAIPGGEAATKAVSGSGDVAQKAKAFASTGTSSAGANATLGDKAKSIGKDAATEMAVGAVQGSGGGWIGAGVGAAKGLGKAAAKNKHARNGIIIAIAASLLAPVIGILMIVVLVAGMSGTRDNSNEQATVKAMVDTGKDEAFVIEARDVVKGSTIPWQIAAAVKHVMKADVDPVKLELAMRGIDPNNQWQNMEAGTVYSSSSPTRLQGSGENAADAKKVKDTWVAGMLAAAVAPTEKDAAKIYDIALTWYLGQSFGQCDFVDKPEGATGETMTFDTEQGDNAELIIGLAKSAFVTRGAATQAAKAALVAAIQLSQLRNNKGDPGVDDAAEHTGVFAQPYALVETPEFDEDGHTVIVSSDKRTDVNYTIATFYKNLNAVAGWQELSPGDAAEAVLGSEKRGNYFPWENFADQTLTTNYAAVSKVPMPSSVRFTPIERPDTPTEDGSVSVCAPPAQNYLGDAVLPIGNPAYRISSNYGMRFHPIWHKMKMHNGLDFIGGGCGEPILAVEGGTVTFAHASDSVSFGTHVEIQHANGFMSTYSHMIITSLLVKVGDTVGPGQQIGNMGTTGDSTGCHLHFEAWIDGVRLDPRIPLLERGLEVKPL
jgi:murein DD-endopeptidase MepM/ murein hydrolase activator NlpD